MSFYENTHQHHLQIYDFHLFLCFYIYHGAFTVLISVQLCSWPFSIFRSISMVFMLISIINVFSTSSSSSSLVNGSQTIWAWSVGHLNVMKFAFGAYLSFGEGCWVMWVIQLGRVWLGCCINDSQVLLSHKTTCYYTWSGQ